MRKIVFLLVLSLQVFFASCATKNIDPGLSGAVQYGLAKINFYKIALEPQTNFRLVPGEVTLSIEKCKTDINNIIYYVKLNDLTGVDLAIFEDSGKYFYSGCVSDNDLKLGNKCGPWIKTKIKIDDVQEEDFLKYFDRNDETIRNIKEQLISFLDTNEKKSQEFFIAPFGPLDSELRVYWKQKNQFIAIGRQPEDWKLNKISFAQTRMYDPLNPEEINKAEKYGVGVIVSPK